MYPIDLADILENFDQKHLVMVFRLLAKEEAAETFTYMNSDMRELLINALTDSELEEVMEEMYLDDTVDVLEEMPANVVDRLLMATDEETDHLYLLCHGEAQADRPGRRKGTSYHQRIQDGGRDHGHEYAVCAYDG